MGPEPIKLMYNQDKTLEVHLDTTDFFVDGNRGHFPSRRCRDFVVAVVKASPKTATFSDLKLRLSLGNQDQKQLFKKLAHDVKERFEGINLWVPVLESVRSEGYRLADGWRFVSSKIKSKHLAFDLLSELNIALDRARSHVDKTTIVTNKIGLQYVERSEVTTKLARDNYTLIEDVGWQLIHVLSSCGITNDNHPDVLEVKKKIEKIISYALFWRIGDSLTEEKWRKDFNSEVTNLRSP